MAMVGGDSDTKMLSPFHNARDVESEKLTEGSSAEPHEVDTASLPLLATVHIKTKKTRRFILGACIVAVLFVIATCVPLYFGLRLKDMKNKDVEIWTNDRSLHVHLEADASDPDSSFHSVELQRAVCDISVKALSDESSGVEATVLTVDATMENVLLARRAPPSKEGGGAETAERSRVDLEVSRVDFDRAWEARRALETGDVRLRAECALTLDAALFGGWVKVRHLEVQRSHEVRMAAGSASYWSGGENGLPKGPDLAAHLRELKGLIAKVLNSGAAAPEAQDEEGKEEEEEDLRRLGGGVLKRVTFDEVMGYEFQLGLPLSLRSARTFASLTVHLPALEFETSMRFGDAADDWEMLANSGETYSMRYIVGSQATTWVLHAPAAEGTHAKQHHSPQPEQQQQEEPAAALVVYVRASCSAVSVEPCADQVGEDLEWVSREIFLKPALEWLASATDGRPGGAYEKATLFARMTNASDFFVDSLVGHLHAMSVVRELREDATQLSNQYEVVTSSSSSPSSSSTAAAAAAAKRQRQRQLWESAGECVDVAVDGTFKLTTCGWLDKHGTWARGLVQFSEDRSGDGAAVLTKGGFQEKFFADASLDGHDDDEATGVTLIVPLVLRWNGNPEYDGTLRTWFSRRDVLDGFDDKVMQLHLDDYLDASIALTKHASSDDESTNYFQLGLSANLTVFDGHGERVLRASPTGVFSVSYQEDRKELRVGFDPTLRIERGKTSDVLLDVSGYAYVSTEGQDNSLTWTHDGDLFGGLGFNRGSLPVAVRANIQNNKDNGNGRSKVWCYAHSDLTLDAEGSNAHPARYVLSTLRGPMDFRFSALDIDIQNGDFTSEMKWLDAFGDGDSGSLSVSANFAESGDPETAYMTAGFRGAIRTPTTPGSDVIERYHTWIHTELLHQSHLYFKSHGEVFNITGSLQSHYDKQWTPDDYDAECAPQIYKAYCQNTTLYFGECGDDESCPEDCHVGDFTEWSNGTYYCDPSDPFSYFYDEDLDGVYEETGSLPENFCVADGCDDDDDDDDHRRLLSSGAATVPQSPETQETSFLRDAQRFAKSAQHVTRGRAAGGARGSSKKKVATAPAMQGLQRGLRRGLQRGSKWLANKAFPRRRRAAQSSFAAKAAPVLKNIFRREGRPQANAPLARPPTNSGAEPVTEAAQRQRGADATEERHMASIDSNDRLRSARAHIVEKRRLKSQKAKATAAARVSLRRNSKPSTPLHSEVSRTSDWYVFPTEDEGSWGGFTSMITGTDDISLGFASSTTADPTAVFYGEHIKIDNSFSWNSGKYWDIYYQLEFPDVVTPLTLSFDYWWGGFTRLLDGNGSQIAWIQCNTDDLDNDHPTVFFEKSFHTDAHESVDIQATFYFGGSRDYEEDSLYVDGHQVLVFTATYEGTCDEGSSNAYMHVDGSFELSFTPYNPHESDCDELSTVHYSGCQVDVSLTMTHSGNNITVAFGSNIDEDLSNEMFAFGGLEMSMRNEETGIVSTIFDDGLPWGAASDFCGGIWGFSNSAESCVLATNEAAISSNTFYVHMDQHHSENYFGNFQFTCSPGEDCSSPIVVSAQGFVGHGCTESDKLVVHSGDCYVCDSTLYSPAFPLDYPANHYCEVEILESGKIGTDSFDLERCYAIPHSASISHCDYIEINGVQYTGGCGPGWIDVNPGDRVKFYTDSTIAGSFALSLNVDDTDGYSYDWCDDDADGQDDRVLGNWGDFYSWVNIDYEEGGHETTSSDLSLDLFSCCGSKSILIYNDPSSVDIYFTVTFPGEVSITSLDLTYDAGATFRLISSAGKLLGESYCYATNGESESHCTVAPSTYSMTPADTFIISVDSYHGGWTWFGNFSFSCDSGDCSSPSSVRSAALAASRSCDSSTFVVESGGCSVCGSELFSPSYPFGYEEGEYCSIRIQESGTLYVWDLNIGDSDNIIVDNVGFNSWCGEGWPHGKFIEAGSMIYFSSSSAGETFQIFIDTDDQNGAFDQCSWDEWQYDLGPFLGEDSSAPSEAFSGQSVTWESSNSYDVYYTIEFPTEVTLESVSIGLVYTNGWTWPGFNAFLLQRDGNQIGSSSCSPSNYEMPVVYNQRHFSTSSQHQSAIIKVSFLSGGSRDSEEDALWVDDIKVATLYPTHAYDKYSCSAYISVMSIDGVTIESESTFVEYEDGECGFAFHATGCNITATITLPHFADELMVGLSSRIDEDLTNEWFGFGDLTVTLLDGQGEEVMTLVDDEESSQVWSDGTMHCDFHGPYDNTFFKNKIFEYCEVSSWYQPRDTKFFLVIDAWEDHNGIGDITFTCLSGSDCSSPNVYTLVYPTYTSFWSYTSRYSHWYYACEWGLHYNPFNKCYNYYYYDDDDDDDDFFEFLNPIFDFMDPKEKKAAYVKVNIQDVVSETDIIKVDFKAMNSLGSNKFSASMSDTISATLGLNIGDSPLGASFAMTVEEETLLNLTASLTIEDTDNDDDNDNDDYSSVDVILTLIEHVSGKYICDGYFHLNSNSSSSGGVVKVKAQLFGLTLGEMEGDLQIQKEGAYDAVNAHISFEVLEMLDAEASMDGSVFFSYKFDDIEEPLISGLFSFKVMEKELAKDDFMTLGLLLEGDENLLEAKFVSTEKDGEVLASAELKANVEVEEFSYSYYDVWGIVGDMSIDVKGKSEWDMIGRSSVDLTSFHNDKFNMLAKALVTTDSETLLYGRATLDLDGENILTSPSETTASAVLDIDKSNYLTMEMEMITDGDMSGGDNDRHSLSCMHADMYMEDPMHLKALDLNMTTSLFLMNNANNGFRGVVVEDHNVGIALREYPSDFTQAQCEATMQISMKMVSYGRSGATIVAAPSQQPTTHPTMHPSMQPTSPCPGGPCGFCYSGRSTVAVKVPRKSGIMISKPLHQVKVGDYIFKKDSKTGVLGFTKVLALHHSRTTQPTLHIVMQSKHIRRLDGEHILEATTHHTFPRCGKTLTLVKAKDLKQGDCLNTPQGNKLVAKLHKLSKVDAEKYETYTVVTQNGFRDLIAVGGVLAHATSVEHRDDHHYTAPVSENST